MVRIVLKTYLTLAWSRKNQTFTFYNSSFFEPIAKEQHICVCVAPDRLYCPFRCSTRASAYWKESDVT